jgi:hypothetical protein
MTAKGIPHPPANLWSSCFIKAEAHLKQSSELMLLGKTKEAVKHLVKAQQWLSESLMEIAEGK